MWSFADRVMKTMSDVTIGTVIVLVHVMLADRESSRAGTKRLAAPVMPHLPNAQRATTRSPFL
jgi:hypothetical protein